MCMYVIRWVVFRIVRVCTCVCNVCVYRACQEGGGVFLQ